MCSSNPAAARSQSEGAERNGDMPFFSLKCPCSSLYPSTHFLSVIRLFLPSLRLNDIAPSCVRVSARVRQRPVFFRRQAAQACVQLSQEMPPHGSKASSPSQLLAEEET